ncbi:hypothetical protein BD769DRAFT_1384574 [Suillus cothurnatus]|nr:hypothetical protein BD769DRAFT_1384574 [Suillus cothurnatus]
MPASGTPAVLALPLNNSPMYALRLFFAGTALQGRDKWTLRVCVSLVWYTSPWCRFWLRAWKLLTICLSGVTARFAGASSQNVYDALLNGAKSTTPDLRWYIIAGGVPRFGTADSLI